MRSILFRFDQAADDLLIADVWEHGTAGIVEEREGWRAFFPEAVDLKPLLERYRELVLELRDEQEVAWNCFERDNWDPILIGERFFVAPSWVKAATPAGRIRMTIDATKAFGTGRHESTQLAIEALENHIQPGDNVVDIGCGSGILSQAAALLGAGTIVSGDIDPAAVETAAGLLKTPVFLGSAEALRSTSADLVLANISARVIDTLAEDLARIAKPKGRLVLSGFTAERVPQQFHPQRTYEKNGWLCWMCLAAAERALNLQQS